MASLSRQITGVAKNYSKIFNNHRILVAGPSCVTAHRKYAKRTASNFLQRFKVEPRKPIEDLVTHHAVYKDKDPAPIFYDSRVQSILENLTGKDPSKVFRHRKVKNINPPTYEFLSDEQLEEAYQEAAERTSTILSMPPIVQIRQDNTEIISRDPAIQGRFTDKIVITDISADVGDSNRLILVREPDGTLKHASMEQRHRMNAIYNPRPGRSLKMPALFSTKRLKDVLSNKEYEFVLDKACLQMEPYEETFQSVLALTFETVDANEDYDLLLSTRFYGPMAFFFSWHSKIDGLLQHLIKSERMEEVGQLLQLHSIIHPDCKIAAAESKVTEDLLQIYINEESKNRASLELAYQVYKDVQKSKSEYEEDIKNAHGVSSS